MLPSGYTRLSYVSNTGSKYTETDIIPTNYIDTLKIDLDARFNDIGSRSMIIGSGHYASSTSQRDSLFIGVKNSNYDFASGGILSGGTNLGVADTNAHKFIIDQVNNKFMVDNTQASITKHVAYITEPILLFATRRSDTSGSPIGFNAKGDIFGCKLYGNNSLLRNYIPCRRDSDQAIGFYETESNRFYSNTYTGGYDIVESVSGSGTINIDTSKDSIIVTASPNTGYQFDHFDVNGTTYTTNPLTITITQNTTITTYFVSEGYTVTCTISPPTAGTVSGTGTYQENAICTLTPMHNSNNLMRFSHWLKGGIIWSYENLLKVQVTEDVEYTCKFVPIAWQTPVTDRSASDLKARNSKAYMNIEDWNRIEMNCKELQSYSTTISRQYNIYGHYDIPTIEDVRRIRKNILDLAIECFGTYELPMVSTHYSFFNALEQAELDIYNYYNED